MLPYWMLFLLPTLLAFTRLRSVRTHDTRWSGYWRVAFILLVLVIGQRHEVGADWANYQENLRLAWYFSLEEAAMHGDPAYNLLNWLAARMDLGVYFVNTVCAVLFAWGLVVFCQAQSRPWLALVIAMPYLVTVVAMGYTRQGVAIGLVMLGLVALSERKLPRFIVFVALAATFHKSAVILMPLAVLAGSRHRLWTALWVALATLLFYFLLLQESVEALNENYIEAAYESAGAAIRVAMNVLPAVLFLLFRRRFALLPADRIFWTWMSLGALAFVGLLMVSPSSTAVDRVALYWIPLQLTVLSSLPDALGQQNGQNALWVAIVVGYSAAVLFVWLSFAVMSFAWLPYQFYPWILLWQ
jgi:hypothetical protein